MVTRFVPVGYKPERDGQTTVERVHEAVSGLGELIDGYEFHYPQELSPENLDEVRQALEGHDVYCIATGLHLDPRFGKGGLVSPDEAIRREALTRTLDAIDFAGEHGVAPHGATFEDGYRCDEVVAAILRSAESGRKEAVSYR